MPDHRIVIASTGGWGSVSTRDRLRPVARRTGWSIDAFSASPFPSPEQLAPILEAAHDKATLILQRVLPQREQMMRLRQAYGRIIFDLDDAIYATPPNVGGSRIVGGAKALGRLATRGSARASSRRRPLAETLRQVDLCVVGNPILARFAERYAPRVVEIPTAVDPVDNPPSVRPVVPVVVWLGVRDNLQYLELVRRPLAAVAHKVDFTLRIVSTASWPQSPVPVDFVEFSEEAARAALLTATVGLSPLTDDPWTRGKCAMRTIQYGGHALPAIASPVGVTSRVIVDGETGFLARHRDEWESSLHEVLTEPAGVENMGRNALEWISEHYSNDRAVELWRAVLDETAGQ